MRLLLAAVLCLFAALPARAADDFAAYMKAREGLGQFSGVVLVARNGKVLHEGAYGWADLANRRRTALDTRYLAASLTKAFTALAVLKLRDEGRLALGDSPCRWIETCPEA